jgi:transposase
LARHGQALKDKVVARLLAPESASLEQLSRETGIGVQTLERWRVQALSSPAREPGYSAASRLEAVISTASLDEADKNAWCREHGIYPEQLRQWRDSATQALAEPGGQNNAQSSSDRRRIKQLESELRRKEKALAETAALLVLSKKVEAIFNQDRGEDE